MMSSRKLWEDHVGVQPPILRVFERADRQLRVYCSWWDTGARRTRRQELQVTVRVKGRIDEGLVEQALAAAKQVRGRLTGDVAALLEHGTPRGTHRVLLLRDVWDVITHPVSGHYPHPTPHRQQVGYALRDAVICLGQDYVAAAFDAAALRQLTRWKVDQVRASGTGEGYVAAHHLARKVLTVLRMLREDGRLPDATRIPEGKSWGKELRRYMEEAHGGVPEPERPRYTLEEARALFAALDTDEDPRLRLLVALGAELRLKQVLRVTREDLRLDQGQFGQVVIKGRGVKLGEVMELTAGQRVAVDQALYSETGYLRVLEARGQNYLLFRSGRMHTMLNGERVPPYLTVLSVADSQPYDRGAVRRWWYQVEKKAGVPHVRGRLLYGMRRQMVDFLTNVVQVAPDVLQAAGMWASERTPNTIYREQERGPARLAAASMRAAFRGETPTEPAILATPASGQTDPKPTPEEQNS